MKSYFSAALMLVGGLAVLGQDATPTMTCQDHGSSDRLVRHCEIREQTVPYAGQLTVDGGQNGGVQIKGWSRGDMLVRAKVDASAASDAEARALAAQVRINTAAGRISAAGPETSSEHNWGVSYEVFVPHQANVQINTHNGGVHVSDIQGRVEFAAVNGGIHLSRVNGHVQGHTVNGGVHLDLSGSRWEGEGLDVSTTNGGVHLGVPANYSAHLETSTVNGGLHNGVPLTVTGKIGKQISANLGSGGATIRVTTTNGGVHIDQI